MSDFWKAAVLGLIQGVTEFLPVSSSGHLLAAKAILGFDAGLALDVVLHLATLLAVLIYFAGELLRLARGPQRWGVALLVVIGTVPAAAIGLVFHDLREKISPWFVVLGWTLSATYLLLTRGREGNSPYPSLPPARAFLVGGSQGIAAVLPGFSRSGASISSGLWLGLKREDAFRFSFLLAIPVMLGAGLVEGRHLFHGEGVDLPGGWPALAIACAGAFLVGLLAIHLLFRAVVGNHFHRFGWYNLFAAAAFAFYLASR
jgi:undecaprenyl-diphosphatase